MNTAASGLKELHRLHLELQEVRDELESGPRRITACEKLVERREAELEETREQVKQQQMAADQRSLQLKTNEAKIVELKAKLNMASSNREYDIIQSQIDADQMANSVLEDEILEALEKVDRSKQTVAKAEQDVAAAKAQADRTKAEVEASRAELESKVGELQAAITEAEKILPSQIMEQYRRMVQAYGPGALAAVENRACTNCYEIQSPQKIVELNTGKFVFCRSCGRLLYNGDA